MPNLTDTQHFHHLIRVQKLNMYVCTCKVVVSLLRNADELVVENEIQKVYFGWSIKVTWYILNLLLEKIQRY